LWQFFGSFVALLPHVWRKMAEVSLAATIATKIIKRSDATATTLANLLRTITLFYL
jgi:hypothetical protein